MTKPKDGEGAEALLPCPHCGSEIVRLRQHEQWRSNMRGRPLFDAQCAGCYCETTLLYSAKAAIAAWNCRAPPATPVRGGGGEELSDPLGLGHIEAGLTAAMSDNIAALQPPVTTGIVPMLTELLRRAKAGEVSQVAVVAMHPNGCDYATLISDRDAPAPGGHGTLTLIGAVADLQFTLLRLHNQQQD